MKSLSKQLLLLISIQFAVIIQAQEANNFGYLEGTILSINGSQKQALVKIAPSKIIEANIGLSLPDELGNSEALAFKVGQRVELYYSPDPSGQIQYVLVDWVRRPTLLYLVGLFLLVSVLVARFKGLRAFLATGFSLGIVMLYIVPQIIAGQAPILVSLLGVGGILILAIYFVHGLNWSTTAALVGTFSAVVFTMFLGILFSNLAHLTGLGSEEAMMINLNANQVNLKGLMLAGLLVGALGALTDITIVQASVVRELAHLNPKLGLIGLYTRAMNVGLDHIGSLVNTLVLAYTGAALPLLILLNIGDFTWQRALNLELVAAEVIHILVGSIGLILAVPLTTFLAALMFKGDNLPIKKGELEIHQGHSHT